MHRNLPQCHLNLILLAFQSPRNNSFGIERYPIKWKTASEDGLPYVKYFFNYSAGKEIQTSNFSHEDLELIIDFIEMNIE